MARKRRPTKRNAFVVSVIGEPGTDERMEADKALNEIIRPALKFGNVEYGAKRIDDKGGAGRITEHLIRDLLKAELVIVDLTRFNNNVLYEMGLRQAWHVPFIPIIHVRDWRQLPFDIKDLNIVRYDFTYRLKEQAKVQIRKQVRNILKGGYSCKLFQDAIIRRADEFAMFKVYKIFNDALNDMYQSMLKCKTDMQLGIIWVDESLRKDMSRDIVGVFGAMDHKIHVFRAFATGDAWEASDPKLTNAIEELVKLRSIGISLAKGLTGKYSKVTRKSCLSRADQLIHKIEKITVEIRT